MKLLHQLLVSKQVIIGEIIFIKITRLHSELREVFVGVPELPTPRFVPLQPMMKVDVALTTLGGNFL